MRVTGAYVNLFDVFKFSIGRVDLQADNPDRPEAYIRRRPAGEGDRIYFGADSDPPAWEHTNKKHSSPFIVYGTDGQQIPLEDYRGHYIDLRI